MDPQDLLNTVVLRAYVFKVDLPYAWRMCNPRSQITRSVQRNRQLLLSEPRPLANWKSMCFQHVPNTFDHRERERD
eukprot:c124_g1_i1 orf=3-227(-)